jgi:hypothetical protein
MRAAPRGRESHSLHVLQVGTPPRRVALERGNVRGAPGRVPREMAWGLASRGGGRARGDFLNRGGRGGLDRARETRDEGPGARVGLARGAQGLVADVLGAGGLAGEEVEGEAGAVSPSPPDCCGYAAWMATATPCRHRTARSSGRKIWMKCGR